VLVLTRKTDESIVIGDNIVITVLEIERDKVKLGIDAPRDITILRKELFQAVQEQNVILAKLAESSDDEKFKELRELLAAKAEPENKDSDTGDKGQPPKDQPAKPQKK
jgi:carbon storage regulator